jgi:hypothetical protein
MFKKKEIIENISRLALGKRNIPHGMTGRSKTKSEQE